MKKRMIPLFLFVTILLSFSSITYGTAKLKEMEAQKKALKKQMQENLQELKNQKDEISNLHYEILKYDVLATQVQEELDVLEEKLTTKKAEIKKTDEELVEAKVKEKKHYASTKERIRIMYEYGNTAYIEVLLESAGAADFYNRLEYLNKIVEYDKGMLERLQGIRNKIEETEAKLLLEQTELEHIQAETVIRQNEIENILTLKGQEVAKAEQNKAFLERKLQERQKEEALLDKKIEEYIKALERERMKQANAKNLKFKEGFMKWPLRGYTYISSGYGYRKNPVYKKPELHNGLDIPAPAGTPIYAAADGIVMFVGVMRGYGKTIMIDHGENSQGKRVITLYAHCSALTVTKDSAVIGGHTVVGKVGKTGTATGNHLHWSIKIGGAWVDPINNVQR